MLPTDMKWLREQEDGSKPIATGSANRYNFDT